VLNLVIQIAHSDNLTIDRNLHNQIESSEEFFPALGAIAQRCSWSFSPSYKPKTSLIV
jgi:hypothetical protein